MLSVTSPWVNEGIPVQQGEDATIAWSVRWDYATTVGSTTKTVKVFKKGSSTDGASTYMPSGSHTASGNILTMKPLTALVGGEKFIISILIDVDGQTDQFWLEVHALKAETGKC